MDEYQVNSLQGWGSYTVTANELASMCKGWTVVNNGRNIKVFDGDRILFVAERI